MRLVGILSFALWFGGCATEDKPVATVGKRAISAEQLQAFVGRLPDGLKSKEGGDAARRGYLQSLIDRQLLLTEAETHGMDTLKAVQRKVREAVDARVIVLYRARFLAPEATVAEEEVRRVFNDDGYHRERKLNAILVRTRAEIEQVAVELAAGQPFAEVARAHSLDKRSSEQGGELGFIGREAALGLHVPAELFNSLPTNELSNPLPAGRSWHIIRFTEDRPTPYERYRPLIENMLFTERMTAVQAEHFEQLKASTAAALDQAGFRLMLDGARRLDISDLDTSEATLYTYGEDRVTIAAAWQALQRINAQNSLKDSVRALATLERMVLNPSLLRRAARDEGLYTEPEMQRLERRVRDNTLLDAVRHRFAAIDLLTDAEVWEFYDANPNRFYHEEAIEVEELLIRDLTDAVDIKERIAAGTSFAKFADRSVRKSAVNSQAHFHFHPRDKSVYPKLVPAIFGAQQGQLMGPLRVQGGYSLFRVNGKKPGGVEPYEQIQRQARGLLRRERENRAFDDLVKDLRQRHAAQIKIDESQLRQALSDSLVPGP